MKGLPTIPTRLTDELDLSVPIVSAPMSYATSPALVASVVNSGGLGFLGSGAEPSTKLASMIDETRALIPSSSNKSLVSMGFEGWVLDNFDNLEEDKDPRLRTALDKQVAAVWFAYGNDLGKYVTFVRDYDSQRSHQTLVVVTVNSVAEAERAANEYHVDAIVVQGSEAGGRAAANTPPLFELLRDTFVALGPAHYDSPMIWAAGGVMNGAQIAALITLGAHAVVIGTRFLFTEECVWDQPMKSALLSATSSTTVKTARSKAYDVVFPLNVWPEGVEARCIVNQVEKDYVEGMSSDERRRNIQTGKEEYQIMYAGTGVGQVKTIEKTSVSSQLAMSLDGS